MTTSGVVLSQASLPCVFVVALCLWPPTPSAGPAPVSPPHRHTPRPAPQRDNVMCHVIIQQPHPQGDNILCYIRIQQPHSQA